MFCCCVALASAFVVAGCQMVIDDLFPTENGRIELKAGYRYSPSDTGASQSTRGTTADNSGVLLPGTITGADLPIGLVRLDQTKAAHDAATPLSFVNLTKIDCTLDDTPDANMMREIFFPTSQFFANADDYVYYLGWYPRGTFTSTATSTSVVCPIDGKTDVLYSSVTSGNQTDGMESMVFDHALCHFNIYIYKMHQVDTSTGEELEEGITNWGYLRNITLEGAPKNATYTLPDKFSFNYNDTQSISMGDWVLTDVNTGAGNNVDNGNGIYFNGGDIPVGFASKRLATHFLTAPPKEGLLDLDITTTLASAAKSISIASDYKAGYSYDIVLCFSEHGFINAEVSVGPWTKYGDVSTEIEADIYFDLSRYGTSNSYIVSSANTGYCFDGDVMGCGNDKGGATLVGVSNCTLNPAYIDILYTSQPDLITLKSHQLNDGSVFFFVPGTLGSDGKYDKTNLKLLKEGNVIIAAYDEREGNILWTWHIWITDRPKEQGYMNGYSVLDRNLGATHTPTSQSKALALTPALKEETYGYYYQWGRKDPMILSAPAYTTSTERVTPAVAAAHPMTYYGASSAVNDWNSSPNQHLWGYVSAGEEYVKTIYDPCPVGYRVPEKRVWDELSNSETTPFGIFSVASVYAWYASAGYIGSGNYTTPTDRETSGGGIYNASCQPSDANNIYHFEYNATNKKAVAGSASNGTHTRSYAYPVRCISTTVQSVVTNLSRVQTANSYIVSESGHYKFNATVRGNGVVSFMLQNNDGTLTPANVGDGMTANITGINKVDLLWWQGDLNGTNNTSGTDCPIELVSTQPDAEGYIQFGIDTDLFSKGNAILAAFDSSNNILWTWHIWLTDTPDDVVTGDYTVMDRNLGATYVPTSTSETWSAAKRLATYGFYYQWGRKDPFQGPSSYNTTTESTASSTWYYKNPSTGVWSQRTSITAASASAVSQLAVAAANPTTFYYSSTKWCPNLATTALTSLWGYGMVDQSGSGSGLSKTVNDPCPPGYQVCHHHTWGSAYLADSNGESNTEYYIPSSANLYGHFITGAKNASGNYTTPRYTNYNTSSPTQSGVILADFSWYPFQGYRAADTGNVSSVGTYATSYTALPMGSAGEARSYQMYSVDYFSYFSWSYIYYTATRQMTSGYNANGRAVRCAKQ